MAPARKGWVSQLGGVGGAWRGRPKRGTFVVGGGRCQKTADLQKQGGNATSSTSRGRLL